MIAATSPYGGARLAIQGGALIQVHRRGTGVHGCFAPICGHNGTVTGFEGAAHVRDRQVPRECARVRAGGAHHRRLCRRHPCHLDRANQAFQTLQTAIASSFGWFYVFTANALLLFALAAAFGRGGSVRLGGADARPEFSRWEWFAMLFSAGMGIGLLFYAVAEPLLHYQTPPGGETTDAATAARDAMGFTFLHWGLHAWAIYGVIGLGLALVAFNRGLPLTVGAVLAPILPKRSRALRHAIDVLAIVATVFGIATSLGLGATQVNAGISRLFGLDNSLGVQLVLVAVITAIALVSVALGLSAGIKRLSELNMSLAGLLGLFVLFGGPTLFILNGLVENIGHYLQHLPRLATWNETWTGGEWQNDWDRLLLRVVDFLGALRRHVHRPHLARAHGAGVRLGRAPCADAADVPLAHHLRQHGAAL